MRPILSLAAASLSTLVALRPASAEPPTRLPGLHFAAEVVRDGAGIPHVRAGDEHDVFFLQGWVHAQDRLFQMDVTRRRASGTLAELLGAGALPGDVQLRTLGLRRAAERSLEVISPRALAALDAYAEGVNAWADTHPLPPEYTALELTTFQPWTVLDSAAVAKLLAFGLSFDLDDIERTVALATYQQAGVALAAAGLGFDGTKLFFEDLFRAAPFDPASSVPDALLPPPRSAATRGRAWTAGHVGLDPAAVDLARRWLGQVREDPFLARLLDRDRRDGSNQWVVAGSFTQGGVPLLASDPHLALGAPSTFYPIHLQAGPFDVIGNSFPGVPVVAVGHNRHIAWGATVDPFDVTDVFQERLVPDSTSPSGLVTIYKGAREAVIPIPESYSVNVHGVVVPVPAGSTPAATLIVPRRNGGPLVQVDLQNGTGLSVQYTGFSGTREIDTFLGFDSANDLAEFQRALATFDIGSQNFCYADDAGNIGYFTYSAVPLREDLQNGAVAGLPPAFIRNGTGGNEWLSAPASNGGAIPYALLPVGEFPHVVNPPAGFVVNANNDPAGLTLGNNPLAHLRPGGGIYYLAPGFDAGFRAGRITERVRQVLSAGKMTFAQMQAIQADVTMLDAQVLVPAIGTAFANARRQGAPAPLLALGAEPAIADAVGRLAAWDGSTPTGIAEGYDAAIFRAPGSPPTADDVRRSVAATIYAVWRGRLVRNVIDARLQAFGELLSRPGQPVELPVPPDQQAMTAIRNLLDGFPEHHGVGASGVDFFAVPGFQGSPEDRRDLIVLQSLADALSLLSGPDFAPAFGGSTNPDDWRWGKLHRIVFQHPMGGPFSVPPAFGEFPAPLAGLPGIPTDGGFGVPDASNHGVRAARWDQFMFGSGPSNRLVVELSRGPAKRAESVWPGGASALPTSPYYLNLLPLWLRNETVPLHFRAAELGKDTASAERFVP